MKLGLGYGLLWHYKLESFRRRITASCFIHIFVKLSSVLQHQYNSMVLNNVSKSLFLDLDKPTFNTSSQISTSIAEGRYLYVVCNAISNPNAAYRWTNSSGRIISNARILVLPTIQRSDAKIYTCIANNSAGLETMSSLMIDVQCELKFFTFFFVNVFFNVTHKIVLQLII